MGRAVAIVLALMALGSEANAYCHFAAHLFDPRSPFGQHVDDEATGDEFKVRHTGLSCS